MEKAVTREHIIKYTGEYCGDHIKHEPCPQMFAPNYGTAWWCNLYYPFKKGRFGFPQTSNGMKTYRCNGCLVETGDLIMEENNSNKKIKE